MGALRTIVLLATCLGLAFSVPVDDVVKRATPAAVENYRLPTDIMPTNYKIALRPHLLESDGAKRFTFDGEVFIEILPKVYSSQIKMHTKNLNFTSRELWKKNVPDMKTQLNQFDLNPVTDIITYNLTTGLAANQTYILHFVYTGSMDDDMHGFYRSSYTDARNVTKWLGSTQFQTNHARRAFPSFDEPKFKATFDVTLVRHKSMKTVSCTRMVSSKLNGDYLTDVYATTPKMSTYLLAFIFSDFNERSNGDFAVIARPEYYDQTEYSYNIGQKVMVKLENYLGIRYYSMGIDKMHLAAIPDFSAGAMENWGLVTYRERALLYEEGSSTLNSKQYIAVVVAHEQTHMWFGNLVTCDWWSYTWLNEGFARYFQYFGAAMVESGFELEKQFVVDQIQTVMNMDSTNSTNPMSDENTNTPADLSRMFNSISYNKGASFIRMVKHVMGEQNFQRSLREYLKANKYQNAVPGKLFYFWKKFWPAPFAPHADGLFQSFTEQVGYPVITVNVTSNSSFEISQQRFLLKENDGSDKTLLYTVPITYTTSTEGDFSSTTPKLFLPATTDKVTVPLVRDAKWVIANIQETGYYRVNYDAKNWHRIHHALYEKNWSGIHELNRAQIVDDLFNLARAGIIDYDLAFNVLEYLETETHYLPWTAAFNGYSYLATRMGTDTKSFGAYIRKLSEKAYKQLGFIEKPTDSALDIYNRAKILAWSCKYGNTECIAKAKELFKNNLSSSSVPVNIRTVVYCTAMREGTEQDFERLFSKYKTETVSTEVTLILNSLGCVKNKALVTKHFNTIMSDQVRRQDKSSALSSLYSENNENVMPVFNLVTANFEQLASSMGDYSSVASVISKIALRFTEESQLKKLREFNAQNKEKFGKSATTLELAEKSAEENLQWAAKKLVPIRNYLNKRSSASVTARAFTALTLIVPALVAMLLH